MPGKRQEITEVVPDQQSLTNVARELITAAAAISIGRRGFFRLALSGGSTPRPIYELLAQDPDIDWKRWQLFWSDERTVPPEHLESNYRMVRESLLDHLAIEPMVLRIPAEGDPAAAAAAYENTVRRMVPANPRVTANDLPRFDMILLGMGGDGHTASLFPNTAALDETERLVVANEVPQLNTTRITFTVPLINAARRVLFLVSGADKAEMLEQVISGPTGQFPSQRIHLTAGNLIWLVHEPACPGIQSDLQADSR